LIGVPNKIRSRKSKIWQESIYINRFTINLFTSNPFRLGLQNEATFLQKILLFHYSQASSESNNHKLRALTKESEKTGFRNIRNIPDCFSQHSKHPTESERIVFFEIFGIFETHMVLSITSVGIGK